MLMIDMTSLLPVAWLLLGIVLAVVEGFSVQLTAIWFAIGAAAAAVSGLLGLRPWPQVAVFLTVSGLLLVLTRPFVKRTLRIKKQSTNADRVIGQTGVVKLAIDNDRDMGRVYVMGLEWSARAEGCDKIATDAKVRVLRIEGVKLIVEPLQEL